MKAKETQQAVVQTSPSQHHRPVLLEVAWPRPWPPAFLVSGTVKACGAVGSIGSGIAEEQQLQAEDGEEEEE